MRILTFRASTIQEALQLVRENLGPDASVVNTRQVRRGLFSKSMIEVEASRDLRVPSRFSTNDRRIDLSLDQSDLTSEKTEEHNVSLSNAMTATISDERNNRPAQTTHRESDYLPMHQPDGATPSLIAHSPFECPVELSPTSAEVVAEMIAAGVAERLARELVWDASSRCDQAFQQDTWLIRGQIIETVAKRLPIASRILPSANEQRTLAFVGPAGTGKTTMLCRLASQAHFDAQLEVGIIAVDSWRSDSIDHLLGLADTIYASVEAVSSAGQLTKALQRLRECDLVMIDTSGRAPNDFSQMGHLHELLKIAQPDEIHLVMEGNSEPTFIELALERFSQLGATQIDITKLDETVGVGQWLSCLLESNTPIPVDSLTHGRELTGNMIQPSPRHWASILAGQKVFKASST